MPATHLDESASHAPQRNSDRHWIPAAAAVSIAGWGANQFAPLSVAYRTESGWHSFSVAVMFSTYLLGLIPGLLSGGHIASRRGRRIVRPALALSATASAFLVLGQVSQVAVYGARIATGFAAGLIFAAGSAWVTELSRTSQATGARRVTFAMGAGFGAGALLTGVLVQWLPAPEVLAPLGQAVLALVVFIATRNVPETADPAVPGTATPAVARAPAQTTAISHPRFLRVILPGSPAVFGAATVAYVILPPLVANQVTGFAPLFSGLVAALTVAIGIAVQPLATWLDHSNSARATLVAIATVISGLVMGAAAVTLDSAVLVVAAAIPLGAGYGLTSASALREIERLAPAHSRRTTMSLYQVMTYLGFLTPLLFATMAGAAPYPVLLLVLAALGTLCLAITAVYSRRHLPVP